MINNSNNKKYFIVKCLVLIFTILIFELSYAGTMIETNGFKMYKNDYGDFAKDTWVWIDTNKDSIAECYRFDKDGHLAKNYKDRYGKETNNKGQLIEHGEVIKKMLSSGEIVNNNTPASGLLEFLDSIINSTNKTIVKKDKWTKKEEKIVEYETNGINESIDGKVLYANFDKNQDIDILNGETAESGVIYSSEKISDTDGGEKENIEIVVGKDFRRFISTKNKCTEKVPKVNIYGGVEWKDVLELYGNGAYVKILLSKNNYIRFEVANENHYEEIRDTDITIDMYVDGVLVDSLDEFVDDKPQVVEEYFDEGAKAVELKLNIKNGAKTRKVYIRNGRLKKVKINE